MAGVTRHFFYLACLYRRLALRWHCDPDWESTSKHASDDTIEFVVATHCCGQTDELPSKSLLEFQGRQIDVTENLSERADFERAVAVNGHNGVHLIAVDEMVAATNATNRESFALEKTQHVFAADARELSHE